MTLDIINYGKITKGVTIILFNLIASVNLLVYVRKFLYLTNCPLLKLIFLIKIN